MADIAPVVTPVEKTLSPVVLPSEGHIEEDGVGDDDLTKSPEEIAAAEAEVETAKVKAEAEAKAGDDGKPKEGEGGQTPEEIIAAQESEIRELRRLSRGSKKESDELRDKVSLIEDKLRAANMLEEVDEEAVAAANKDADVRKSQLETLYEAMKMNPQYQDIESVVTNGRLDDVIDALSEVYVEEHGGDKRDAAGLAEEWVWSMANPYKYLYENIKKNHPDYAKAGSEEGGDKGGKKPIAHEGPTNISALGGGSGSDKAGWTAAQIDAMNEDDLEKVPEDVYNKYLQNLLK